MTLLSQLKKARLFGHPIHSMLVHFPSALFPMSLIFDILAMLYDSQCLACAAFYSLGAGVILGFLSAVIGSIDYARLPASHHAWNKASLHALLSVTWLIVFSVLFGLRCKHLPIIPFATGAEIMVSAIAVLGLVVSNYLGGDLIFRHKLGFEEIDN